MALDIPLHKLEEYRATARRRATEQAAAREMRLERARPAAGVAATLLRERFGASQVWLFGSLAEETTFGMHSDIDLDHCDPDLRDRITRAGVPL